MIEQPDRRAELALAGLVRLLEHCGEARWLKWARGHLNTTRESGLSPTLLDAYGGVGSFNDLILDPANGHALEQTEVPWANRLLAVLGERLYQLAVEITDERFAAEWVHPADPPIEGWRCLACGHSEIPDYDIEWWAARILVPASVADSTLEDPDELVATLLSGQVIGAAESRADVMSRATASGLQVAFTDGIMRPCTSCGSGDTARYRWIFAGGGLHPAEDNLELRKPGHEYRSETDTKMVGAAMQEEGAKGVAEHMWHLGPTPHEQLLDAQTKIMEAVRGLAGSTYLAIYEELERTDQDGWQEVAEHTWLIPESMSSRATLENHLETGVWQMYVADSPVPETHLPDLFKFDSAEVATRLSELGVSAMIDAWHDNTEWRVAIALSES
jgi:uncharacterized protein DUF6966